MLERRTSSLRQRQAGVEKSSTDVLEPGSVRGEQPTVGEFVGKIKYGRLLKPGQRIEDVIFDEKVREDAVRDLGLQVVRWLWSDLYRRGVLRERVLRAFARAS